MAIQGPCVGGGVDLITACDIRLCVKEAWFQIKVRLHYWIHCCIYRDCINRTLMIDIVLIGG